MGSQASDPPVTVDGPPWARLGPTHGQAQRRWGKHRRRRRRGCTRHRKACRRAPCCERPGSSSEPLQRNSRCSAWRRRPGGHRRATPGPAACRDHKGAIQHTEWQRHATDPSDNVTIRPMTKCRRYTPRAQPTRHRARSKGSTAAGRPRHRANATAASQTAESVPDQLARRHGLAWARTRHSARPPAGHAQPQNARPSTSPLRNCSANSSMLPAATPASAMAMIT